MVSNYIDILSKEMNVAAWQVQKTITLLDEGATVPFISRYRKEMTGTLDEVQVAQVRDRVAQIRELDKRRDAIVASIEEQGKMTTDLQKQIDQAVVMSELEDIYLPYRPKRKTRATMAIDKGLEPLAKILMVQNNIKVAEKAVAFINKSKGVETTDVALAGARDIIAEWVNETR